MLSGLKTSGSFLAGISIWSPQKIVYFHYVMIYFLDESIQNNALYNFENKSFYLEILSQDCGLVAIEANSGEAALCRQASA